MSRLIPAGLWEHMEYASAYFAGKGSGSDSLGAEMRAAAGFMKGDALVIFDVGANHGDWTDAAFALLGKRVAAIYQFEPSEHNISLLKKKFSDPRVILIPCAASDRAGDAELFLDVPGSGMASLYKRKLDHANIALKDAAHIRTTTIDEVIAERRLSKVDFMKMDIEGHELAALKGAARSLANGTIQALSFEFGGCNIDSRTYFQDFWYFLLPLGYKFSESCPMAPSCRSRNTAKCSNASGLQIISRRNKAILTEVGR